MPGALRAVLTAAWAVPAFLFINTWTLDRCQEYFTGTYEHGMKGFVATMFAPGSAERSQVVIHAFGRNVWRFFDAQDFKYRTIRAHIALGAILVVLCQLQLLPIVRRASMKWHRRLGYVFLAVWVPFIMEQALTLGVWGMVPMGTTLLWTNALSTATMAITTPLGIWYARHHQVRKHRACMMLCAAALYVNPIQRFIWAVVNKQIQYGAPWETMQAWLDGPTALSGVLAVGTSFSVALAYTALATAPSRSSATINGSAKQLKQM